jgi:hypothetical protein
MLSHRAKQPIISWASAPIGADANMTARLEDVELSPPRRRFLRRPHRRLKLQQVDVRQHGRAPWCALTVSGQGGAFGSLAAAALRAGASADSGILSCT